MECCRTVPRTLSQRLVELRGSSPRITQQCRAASTFRRTKNALRIPPAPSFAQTTGGQDHVIYNPPPSAPNIYHTPMMFLPKKDPRRKLHQLALQQQQQQQETEQNSSVLLTTASSRSRSAASPTSNAVHLPPAVRPEYQKNYHLTKTDVAEIRRLRAEDPRKWTRVRLAEKFGCSQFFVGLCASAPEIKAERQSQLEEVKSRWGRTKREAREERQMRKETWGRA